MTSSDDHAEQDVLSATIIATLHALNALANDEEEASPVRLEAANIVLSFASAEHLVKMEIAQMEAAQTEQETANDEQQSQS